MTEKEWGRKREIERAEKVRKRERERERKK